MIRNPSQVPLAPEQSRSRPPVGARERPRTSALDIVFGLLAVALVGMHLTLARKDFELDARALLAVPVLPLMWELRRNLRGLRDWALPANAVGLGMYYFAFSFPAFFDVRFKDLRGPVDYTDDARLLGAAAVALGALALYGGMRLGEPIGERGRRVLLFLSPPGKLPSGYPRMVVGYSVVCAIFLQLLVTQLPQALTQFFVTTISFQLAVGLVAARLDLFRGPWSRYLSSAVLWVGGVSGLLSGWLDPILRLGIVTVAARWAYTKRIAVTFIVVLLAVFVLLQPIKNEYRDEVWRGRTEQSYSQRVDAWVSAFGNFWFGERYAQEKATEQVIERIGELDAVNHAFLVLPGRVHFLDGSGWAHIPSMFVPRILWPDKPTTRELRQRYPIVFGRQTERGALTTAFVLPLLVDGYWNFGWPGIIIACTLMGLWVGFCQTAYAGTHWALRAMGVAQVGSVVVHGSMQQLYVGIFQNLVGLLVATWAIYWIAAATSPRLAHVPLNVTSTARVT